MPHLNLTQKGPFDMLVSDLPVTLLHRRDIMRKRVYQYVPPAPAQRELDYQLASDVLRGDPEAWEQLYLEAYAPVMREIRRFDDRRFFSIPDYEDIADEAFAKCYEQLERYQGLSRFWRWVSGYARNIIRNRKRAQLTVWRNQRLMEDITRAKFRNVDPLHLLIQLERNRVLWDAFFQLDLPERTILYRRVFFCTPFRELANMFQLTQKQARQLYQDAVVKTRWNYLRQYR